MVILIKVLQFLACLSLLVLIHEFGHFIAARIFRIRVDKFYIFFDPWFSLFKFRRGHTEYGMGWLPLGGYVKIAGMIDESMDTEQMKQPVQPWEFRAKPAWQRLIVMLAGVLMNVLLAIVIYSGVLYTWGRTYYANDDMVNGYAFNEAGHRLGFEDGDRIVSIDGREPVNVNEILQSLLITDADREVVVERGGERIRLTLPMQQLIEIREKEEYKDFYTEFIPYIVLDVETEAAARAGLRSGDRIIAVDNSATPHMAAGIGRLEAAAGTTAEVDIVRDADTLHLQVPVTADARMGITVAMIPPRHIEYTLAEALPAGWRMTGEKLSDYWRQLKMIVNPQTKLIKEVGGFIAIGNIFPAQWNWQSFWMLTALISIMLAVMNLLPIPGLDGGHALFTLWEIITRRKPSDRFMEIMQYIGIALILLLVVYANGNDIVKLFR